MTLHVHLGLFGKFGIWSKNPPPPTEGTRMRWTGEPGVLHLAGPTACELMEPARRGGGPRAARSRPAGGGARGSGSLRRCAAAPADSRRPGTARPEGHRRGSATSIGPSSASWPVSIPDGRPKGWPRRKRASSGDWPWTTCTVGERIGRIVTVDPAEAGVARWRDVPGGERLYAYKRKGRPCRRCGDEIRRTRAGEPPGVVVPDLPARLIGSTAGEDRLGEAAEAVLPADLARSEDRTRLRGVDHRARDRELGRLERAARVRRRCRT